MHTGTKFLRKAAALLSLCILFGVSGTGQISSEAAERPEYLKSVTYFGDEWPINFWGSEDSDMEENLARIANDGFNSIILVVPWREFQPQTFPMAYNQAAFDKLDAIMDAAARHDLWVVMRIGYTWDYYGNIELPKRFENVMQKDSPDYLGWLDYCRVLYEAASAHENFHSGFITWEDFWDVTYATSREIPMSTRIKMAKKTGYQDYLAEHYTLEEVNKIYRKDFQEFAEVYVPFQKDPSGQLFYEFYDVYLNGFLAESQQVFPGLSMEVRCDGDLIYDLNGNYSYYSHSVTYPCEGADYTALMYSVSLGQRNESDRISADTALEAMKRNLESIYELSKKPLYLEQLLYMDSTAEFSYNTQIEEEQVGDFVSRLAPVLEGPTNGYGLWVYRNYVNNCVYNGQFGLGTEGWSFAADSSVVDVDGTKMARIGGRAGISQKLTGRMNQAEEICVQFYAAPDGKGTSRVTVELGDKVQTVNVTEPKLYQFSIPWQYSYDINISSDQPVLVDNVKVYSYEQYGRIYDTDGKEGDLAVHFRDLNTRLP